MNNLTYEGVSNCVVQSKFSSGKQFNGGNIFAREALLREIIWCPNCFDTYCTYFHLSFDLIIFSYRNVIGHHHVGGSSGVYLRR